MKKLLYITGSRAEYGIMKRLLRKLQDHERIELSIIATGMHCDVKYGYTYQNIIDDGFEIKELFDIKIETSTNSNIISTMSRAQSLFGAHFQDNKYDAIIILGDRYEMLSVAIAASIHGIPIIHLHGGEQTLGNYDEFIRHCITKMSHLHLVATDKYRERVIQLGEPPATVVNIGAMGAENVIYLPIPEHNELQSKYSNVLSNYFMVLFHPETLTRKSVHDQINELIKALEIAHKKNHCNFIFIGSNSDTSSEIITEQILTFCKSYNFPYLVSLPTQDYLGLCKYSLGLIGNSSSGLIEIPSLGVPTINIGHRQAGRERGKSVIDVECCHVDILNKIHDILSNRNISADDNVNPYYKENSADLAMSSIISFLDRIGDNKSHIKKFYDIPNIDNLINS
ncbi:UDP-N-acetylglucosamine 2-epimerase [Escherichia coli]|uniref:UDP-N-acetylglucosamine 2-epimerase n=1 Tax=Escherichia coli TaxID=562 RepID=UPI002974B7AF|nr:UDP-N-acetylglucosamine 2-epimerase [Escherichia coli]HAP6002691.1 UDP-N-acetylglucosamine 2-epimerase (hydrolyzing) [Escherichia coli]